MITYQRIQVTEADTVEEPVSKDELKSWLRVDFNDDDDSIEALGVGARQSIEQFANLALVDKSVIIDVLTTCNTDQIRLYGVDRIEEVTIEDIDKEEEVDVIDFKLRGAGVKINYSGNFSISYDIEAAPVPEALKEAIKMEVAERYANRGENNSTEGLSKSAQAKASPFVQIWL